jgi:hypothetical protein
MEELAPRERVPMLFLVDAIVQVRSPPLLVLVCCVRVHA